METLVMENPTIVEANYIENVLKEYGEPVRLKHIVELTNDKINWTSNSTSQMYKYLKHINVEKSGYGMYEYVAPTPVTSTTPIQVVKRGDTLEMKDEDRKLLENFRSLTTPIFSKQKSKKHRIGDVITGKVTGIEDYGAFINSEDDQTSGLIHITNIKDGVTYDANRHFKFGDIVTAKIVAIKHDGKLSLSTKGFELPDYFAVKAIKVADTANVVDVATVAKAIDNVADEVDNAVDEVVTRDIESIVASNIEVAKKQSSSNEEFKQILDYVQGITGVVSIEAKNSMKEIIDKVGMFKFTMAIMESSKDFKVDVSMLFANEIKKNLGDSYLSDHL